MIGENPVAQGYLLWEALFLFIILVINFIVALNEEYLHRNEIPYRVNKVLGKYNITILFNLIQIWMLYLLKDVNLKIMLSIIIDIIDIDEN